MGELVRVGRLGQGTVRKSRSCLRTCKATVIVGDRTAMVRVKIENFGNARYIDSTPPLAETLSETFGRKTNGNWSRDQRVTENQSNQIRAKRSNR